VIDADYRGEIKVALHNDGIHARLVEKGQKVAQLVVMPFLNISFQEVDELDQTVRGTGGFGSTGKM
jgi:dUTP pyrophosphatase